MKWRLIWPRDARPWVSARTRSSNAPSWTNARIGKGVRIVNEQAVTEADGENYFIRDGIVVIPKNVTVPDGTVV